MYTELMNRVQKDWNLKLEMLMLQPVTTCKKNTRRLNSTFRSF